MDKIDLEVVARMFDIRSLDKAREAFSIYYEVTGENLLVNIQGTWVMTQAHFEVLAAAFEDYKSRVFSLEEIRGAVQTDLPSIQDRKGYIYFLFSEERLIYVGQSVDIRRRIVNHMTDKQFDSFSLMETPKWDLNLVEDVNIAFYLPSLNNKQLTGFSLLKKMLIASDFNLYFD